MSALEQESQKRLHLIKQSNVKTFPVSGQPQVMTALSLKRQTPDQARTSHRPVGYNATAWHALLRHFETFTGDVAPDYKQINVLLEMLCGAPFETTENVTVGGLVKQVKKREFYFPESLLPQLIHYALEYGFTHACKRMLYSLMPSWGLNVKRGNSPSISGSTTLMFNGPVKNDGGTENFLMTGSTPANAKNAIRAVNVTGNMVVGVDVPGFDPQSFTLAIGDNAAAIKGKVEALDGITTVTVTGSVAASLGELHTLIATNAPGNATIYGNITVTPGQSAASLEAAIKLKGGNYANAAVAGSTTPLNGVNYALNAQTQGASSNGDKAVDGDDATYAEINNYSPLRIDLGQARRIYKVRLRAKSMEPIYAAHEDFYFSNDPNGEDVDYENGVYSMFSGNASGGITEQVFDTSSVTTPYRYIFVVTSNSGGANRIHALEAFSQGGPSNGSYSVTFPAGVGNIDDIAPVGTGWAGTSTQPGNTGGTVTVEVTNPATTPVTFSKVSGHAGYTTAPLVIGTDGALDTPDSVPILPQHFSLRKSPTLAALADATPLKGVHETDLQISNVVEPDQVFAEGELGYQNHVGGDIEIKHKTVLVSDELLPSSDCIAFQTEGNADPVQAAWLLNKATHPDKLHTFSYEAFFAISDPYAPTAGGKVFQYEYTSEVELNNELRDPNGSKAIIRFVTTEPII